MADTAPIRRVHERIDKLDTKLCTKLDAMSEDLSAMRAVCPICRDIVLGTDAKPGIKDLLAMHDNRISALERAPSRQPPPLPGHKKHLGPFHYVAGGMLTLIGGLIYGAGEWLWDWLAKWKGN